jgi:hypothetical protein
MSAIHSPLSSSDPRSQRKSQAIATALRAAAEALAPVSRAVRGEASQQWTSLNAHLLADIGESTTTAALETLHRPLEVPLGSIGIQSEVKGQPLLACRMSPLG